MHRRNLSPANHRVGFISSDHPRRRLFARLRGIALATCLMTGLVACGSGGADPNSLPAVTISPLSGTQDASPNTQISVLGVPATTIRSVTVTGSTSADHSGQLMPYVAQHGASFVLDQPLTQGEDVTAVVRIDGSAPVTSSFTVALRPSAVAPFLPFSGQQPDKLDHYVSRPDLLPPKITVNTAAPNLTGDIFLTPLPSPILLGGGFTLHQVGPGGPMIIDGQGRLVWFKQLTPPVVAANLQKAEYGGETVLTWWEGKIRAWFYGEGEGVIADTSYHEIARVKAGNGYSADFHELSLTPEGDALITIYSPFCRDAVPCSPAGSDPTKWPVIDAVVQQIDVATGLVEWEWHALGHISMDDAVVPPALGTFDPYHINSVQALPDGKVLVSLRDTSAIYKIDQRSGQIDWTLGGAHSSFQMGVGATFHFQHDARLLSADTVSLFDNEGGPPFSPPSRGLVLALDLVNKTATVLQQYVRSTDTSANSLGSTQRLPGGDRFVGFGSTPYFSQFSADGQLKFDAALPVDDSSYRVFRFRWSATLDTLPDIAAHLVSPGQVTVYASWNGATRIASWVVLGGDNPTTLSPLASAPSGGFETQIDVATSASTFAVQALDSQGRVLATSAPVSAY